MVERTIYMDSIDSFIDKDIIKIITGIRRCGKSYFFNLIIEKLINQGVNEEDIFLIDLELPQFNKIRTCDELDEVVLDFLNGRKNKTYLFFDEIQNVKGWEISINSYFKLSGVDIRSVHSDNNPYKILKKDLEYGKLFGRDYEYSKFNSSINNKDRLFINFLEY